MNSDESNVPNFVNNFSKLINMSGRVLGACDCIMLLLQYVLRVLSVLRKGGWANSEHALAVSELIFLSRLNGQIL